MKVEDIYRYMIGGYYGVMEFDDYDLKEYILKDIENYIREFVKQNSCSNFNFESEIDHIKNNVSFKVKLQDALLVLNKLDNAPLDLVLGIKKKLKEL